MNMRNSKHKHLRRLVSLIVIGVIVMNAFALLTGCSVFEADTAKTVKKMLKEKYDMDFVVTTMGDRINTGSATLYCYPETDEGLLFTVVYDYSRKTLTDDFPARRSAKELDREIASISSNSSVNFASLTAFYDAKYDALNGNENLQEFLDKSGATELYIHLAVNADNVMSETDAQQVIDALTTISNKYESINILAIVFLLDQEKYDDCVAELQKRTTVNDDWFKSYSPVSSINIKIENGEVQKTAKDLLLAVKG